MKTRRRENVKVIVTNCKNRFKLSITTTCLQISEAFTRKCSAKKVFLKFRKIHRKSSWPQSLLNISKTFFHMFFWCTVNMSLSCSFLMPLLSILKRLHIPWHTFSITSFKRCTKSRARTGQSKRNNEKFFSLKTLKGNGEHLLWRTSTNGCFWKGGTDILLTRFEVLQDIKRDIMGIYPFTFSLFFTRILLLDYRLFY